MSSINQTSNLICVYVCVHLHALNDKAWYTEIWQFELFTILLMIAYDRTVLTVTSSNYISLSCSVSFLQASFSIIRKRKDFGCQHMFSDRNSMDVKDGAIDCPGYEDESYELNMAVLSKAIQVAWFAQ